MLMFSFLLYFSNVVISERFPFFCFFKSTSDMISMMANTNAVNHVAEHLIIHFDKIKEKPGKDWFGFGRVSASLCAMIVLFSFISTLSPMEVLSFTCC